MKHSPLCTRNNGREVYFTVSHDGGKYRLTVPEDFLDDECGAAADEATRTAWVTDNMAHVLQSLTARLGGGMVQSPYGRVVVEGIS